MTAPPHTFERPADLIEQLRSRASCPPECKWHVVFVPHLASWRARHNGGEAIGIEDPHDPAEPSIQPWLKGLHNSAR